MAEYWHNATSFFNRNIPFKTLYSYKPPSVKALKVQESRISIIGDVITEMEENIKIL